MSLQNTSSDRAAETVEDSTATTTWRGSLPSKPSLEALGFWLAVTLPVPTILVLAGGVTTLFELATVGGLLVANLLALYLGREYSTDER